MAERIRTGELAKRLGVSRQRVNDLAREGKLTRDPDGLWDPDKVRGEPSRTLSRQQKVKAQLGGVPPAAPFPMASPSHSNRGTRLPLHPPARCIGPSR